MESDADIKDDKYSVLERGLSEPFLKQRQGTGRFNGFPRTSQTALLGEQVPPDLESLDYDLCGPGNRKHCRVEASYFL